MDAKGLRDALMRLGFSRAKFAEKMGVDPHTVGAWCGGVRDVPGPVVAWVVLAEAIAALGVLGSRRLKR